MIKEVKIYLPEKLIEAAEEHKKEMIKEWENNERYAFLKDMNLEYFISDYICKNCKY